MRPSCTPCFHLALATVLLGSVPLLLACSEATLVPVPEKRRPQKDVQPPSSASEAPPPQVDEETLMALEALGYVDTAPAANPGQRGVTEQAQEASSVGLNLFSSRSRAIALLTDMEGEVVHRWEGRGRARTHGGWMHVEPTPSGALFAISKDHSLAKVAWDSEPIWVERIRAHHDLAIHSDGRVFLLVRDYGHMRHGGRQLPILTDAIAVLSADGELEKRMELLPVMRDRLSRRRLSTVLERVRAGETSGLTRAGGVADVLHTNSIEILEREIPGLAPAGSLLLSFRAISRVAIVDAEVSDVLWEWGAGELEGQHDATHLPNGNILIFDNGSRRGHSRVLEVNPTTSEVEWSYDGPGLFTRLRGGAQRLPNGNVLITESDSGRALEITRDGEKVWEFWNPDVRGEGDDAHRGAIYRLNRFPREYFGPLDDE